MSGEERERGRKGGEERRGEWKRKRRFEKRREDEGMRGEAKVGG